VKQKTQASAAFLSVLAFPREVVSECCIPTTRIPAISRMPGLAAIRNATLRARSANQLGEGAVARQARPGAHGKTREAKGRGAFAPRPLSPIRNRRECTLAVVVVAG